MKVLKDFGIILRRTEYGEADRIITFLTKDHGKTRAIAKGVRRAKSKMAGGLELFSVSELHYIQGRGDIDTITSTRLHVHFGEIVKHLDRTEQAYAMLKLIDKTVEDHTGQEYFSVLHESLAAIDDVRISVSLVDMSCTMRILQLLGNLPDFSKDSHGDSLNPDIRYEFDFEAISFTEKSNGPFEKNHLKVLKLLAYNTPQSMAAVQGINQYVKDLSGLVRALRVQSIGI